VTEDGDMAASRTTPPPYADALSAELDELEAAYVTVLEASEIGSATSIAPAAASCSSAIPVWLGTRAGELEAERMRLLGRVRDFRPRFELPFPHPTPVVAERHRQALDLLERWLLRPEADMTVPGSIAAAVEALRVSVGVLREARTLLPADPIGVRLVVDTNALIDCPDLAACTGQLGTRYRVHVLPVVLRELDDLKRAGRSAELREAASRANRRLGPV